MIFISDNAKKRVKGIMKNDSLGDEYFIRVSVTSGGEEIYGESF